MAKAKVLDEVQLIAAAALYRGNRTQVAKSLGVSRQAVSAFIATHPEVAAAFESAEGSLVDLSKSKVWAAVQKSAPWAIQLVMKTQGGWVEKRAMTGNDGEPVIITVKYEDNPKSLS